MASRAQEWPDRRVYATPPLRADGPWFRDADGRVVMLRGVNLSGAAKLPLDPDGGTHHLHGFFDHRDVNFIGRPFPLDEADEHFERLRRWGLTFLRLVVTWEALEHAGPGNYDRGYLDYLRQLVAKAADHGLTVCIDPHQDTWSRLCGGSGAPGWTLEAVGFDLQHLDETGAAIRHQLHGDPFPVMIWHSNSYKLAAATMFSLFFAGNDLAPHSAIEGEAAQEYLQRHYVAAYLQVVEALRGLPNVLGYGTMNEPMPGYIGWGSLSAGGSGIKLGNAPTPLQAMALGAGLPQRVQHWVIGPLGPRRAGKRLLNSGGASAWQHGRDCVWRENGVWDVDGAGQPRVLREDHFVRVDGRDVDFARDYYRPFANRMARALRAVAPGAIMFIEPEPMSMPPDWGGEDAGNIAFAPHWYDGWVLYRKRYNRHFAVDVHLRRLVDGRRRIHRSFAEQLRRLKHAAGATLGDVPTVLAEFGIPFDLDDGQGHARSDYRRHVAALDRSFRAVETNLLSCALWHYNPHNTNQRGDHWNGEDLSLFSRDQQADLQDPHSGGRALEAIVRPHATAVAGVPLRASFHLRRRHYHLSLRDARLDVPTEIFVPTLQYPDPPEVRISDGEYQLQPDRQRLLYRPARAGGIHTVDIRPRRGARW